MEVDPVERLQSLVPDVATEKSALVARLTSYRVELENLHVAAEFTDLGLGTKLIEGFVELLTLVDEPGLVALIEGGINYLISTDDDVPDSEIGGFDDDAEVFNYICDQCDCPELQVAISA